MDRWAKLVRDSCYCPGTHGDTQNHKTTNQIETVADFCVEINIFLGPNLSKPHQNIPKFLIRTSNIGSATWFSLSFLFTPKYVYFIWLVVYLPLWKYEFVSWEGFGRIIPYMKWKITHVPNMSKPPTSYGCSSPQIWQCFAADASPYPELSPAANRANCRRHGWRTRPIARRPCL